MMADLKRGDRVTVTVHDKKFNGIIVGEGREGRWWNVVKDGNKYSQSFHKSFCQPETGTALSPQATERPHE